MPAKLIIEVTSGPIQGRTFEFDRHDTFLFGRRKDCHAQISEDPKVSRHHFILEANPPDVRIRDLGSRNGTFVNGVKYGGRALDEVAEDAAGRQYPTVDLGDGDRVTVGDTTIQIRIELPVSCCQCGSEISKAEQVKAEGRAAGFMCDDCRGNMVAGRRRRTVLEDQPCERCGKDVSSELGNGRHGQYICQACQTDVMAEAGGLRRLMQEAANKLPDPSTLAISGYELGEELGKGGMGVVYRAVRKCDGQSMAVKIMLASIAVDDSASKRFLREIDILRQLRHRNIVGFHESGGAGSAFYLVMEYCNGGSLATIMAQQEGKLPLRVAKPIMRQCLEGLSCAHGQKLVHRDLKPANILLDNQSGRWEAKIADFGLSKSFESAGLSGMTATGGRGGTYQFMPREQLTEFKYVRPTSDVWSLAATFYNMLTGRYPLDFPLDRDPIEVVLHDKPTPIRARDPDIPASLAEIIDLALAADPATRYQTAQELKAALSEVL